MLDAWAASPARFREDANAEEDYALGGYRDRVVVELAQNAADAASRAGVPGRLRLTLRDRTLSAANTGAPLDAAGVEALSTLRASAKRGDSGGRGPGGAADGMAGGTVGRFGVGFAAVVSVSDDPRIHSATGTVGWSRGATQGIVSAIPALGAELAARSGHVPVLRLPFAGTEDQQEAELHEGADGPPASDTPAGAAQAAEPVPEGFTTVVELPLRDDGAVALVTRLLAETGPALLLALPALAEVVIETDEATRVLTAAHAGDLSTITSGGVVSLWQVTGADGNLDAALLADRPVEERARTTWSVRWAVPVTGGPVFGGPDFGGTGTAGPGTGRTPLGRLPEGVPATFHAPTPTDEPLGLPALLLASFPLTPDRRHVAPGPLTAFLVERAAEAYAGILPGLEPGSGLLDLVPGPVGKGELDARLGRAIMALLPDVPFLPSAEGPVAGTEGPAGSGEGPAGNAGDPDGNAEGLAGQPVNGPSAIVHAPSGLLLDPDAAAGTGQARVRPRDAVLLTAGSPGLAALVAAVLPHLIDGPVRHPAYALLGVRRLGLAELADLLASLDREPAWWRALYTALADVTAEDAAELGAVPVPLADGRLTRGPRGLLLPGPGLENPDRLAVLGLRVVHPAAVSPAAGEAGDSGAGRSLLARLGAIEATPRSALEDPATRAAVAASFDKATEAYYDDEGPGQTADAVLGLVAAVGAEPGDYPWLADLALPGDDGDWYPAGELLLPGSPLAGIIAADAPFGTISEDFTGRHDARALAAAGVLSTFGLLTGHDVELDEDAIDLDLDAADEWAASTRSAIRRAGGTAGGSGAPAAGGMGDPGTDRFGPALPPVAVEVSAVRDLDLVDPARWPQALQLLTRPPLRAALTDPVRVRLPDGQHADTPSYTSWWLRRHLTLNGRRPSELRTTDSDPLLAGLYDPIGSTEALAPALADPVIAAALGVRSWLADLLAEPGGPDDLLARLADPERRVTRPQLRSLWLALATADGITPDDITPPEAVRAIHGDKLVVAAADDILILDAPDLWPLVADQPLILAPYRLSERLADLLDIPLATEEVPGTVESAGKHTPVPEIVHTTLPAAPRDYFAHEQLTVDGKEIPWRYRDGDLHAASTPGLAVGIAWAAGQWHARHLLAQLLTTPSDAARLLADSDLDGEWSGGDFDHGIGR